VATPDQWAKIKELVGAALERELDKRAAFLDQACSSDAALRAEVESLVAAHAASDELSEGPWQSLRSIQRRAEEHRPPTGSFTLSASAGWGTYGWLSKRNRCARRVALKLIRAGMFDAALFAAVFYPSGSRWLLWSIRPSPKCFDAGATPEGQPYFAMEFVDGSPITDYCDRTEAGHTVNA